MGYEDILPNIAEARKAGEFTDFSFLCEGQTIPVHKIIICTQSPVFRAACLGPFTEASSNRYNLGSHSLASVQRMVDYFYTGDYMVEPEEGNTFDSKDDLRRLSVHAIMFALADKYAIKGLETLSEGKYWSSLSQKPNPFDLFLSIPYVYNLTPDSSRGLRDQVLTFARGKLPQLLTDCLVKEAFDEVVDGNPAFAKELLNSFLKDQVMGVCLNCNSKLVPVDVLQCRCKQCRKGIAKLGM